MGIDVVAKRLDCFLCSKKKMGMRLRFKEKVEEGGSSAHHPIFSLLEFKNRFSSYTS